MGLSQAKEPGGAAVPIVVERAGVHVAAFALNTPACIYQTPSHILVTKPRAVLESWRGHHNEVSGQALIPCDQRVDYQDVSGYGRQEVDNPAWFARVVQPAHAESHIEVDAPVQLEHIHGCSLRNPSLP